MNQDEKNNGLASYLIAELKAQIAGLNLNYDLQTQIACRKIEQPVADESVWEETVPRSSAAADVLNQLDARYPYGYPPSLLGW